ncbi:DUF2993 domain-containing protein [uncultured Jatrophihabitans sp.]|uniref:LmeA family phospholipid-binding protein n=1 Tax=uncultured Jatrophihabitans sp. TaxID=1610747 RepID=UPI0035CA8609
MFIGLVLLALLAALSDRPLAWYAESQIEQALTTGSDSAESAHASIAGIPFLTQFATGEYRHVEVDVHRWHTGVIIINSIAADGRDVDADTSDVLTNKLTALEVASLKVTAELRWQDVAAALTHATDGVISVTVTARSRRPTIRVDTLLGSITIPLAVSVRDGQLHIPAGAKSAPIRIPLPTLPPGIHLSTATATAQGIQVTARGSRVHISFDS